jgi:hypothetical protein
MKRVCGNRGRAELALAAVLACVVAAAALAAPAAASEPQPAAGGIILTGFSDTVVQTADGNTIFSEVNTAILTGTFAGTVTTYLTRTAHPTGFSTFQGTVIFTGTVAGRPGTIVWHTRGIGQDTSPPSFQSTLETVDQGTGALQNLHAQATLDVTVPFGSYTGTYHFD